MHLHVHVIPRFDGDMDDPRGGVRGVIPGKQKYGDDATSSPPPEPVGDDPFAKLATFVSGGEDRFVDVLRAAMRQSLPHHIPLNGL